MNNPNERQVGGAHYRSEFQHWDLMAENYGAGYFEAAITKYITRWRKKNGVVDIEKAIHYYEKLLDLYQSGKVQMYQTPRRSKNLAVYVSANKLDETERIILFAIMSYSTLEQFISIRIHLDDLLRQAGYVHFSEPEQSSIPRCPHGKANPGNCDVCRGHGAIAR